MNVVCFGAHPDDGEFFAGGTAIQWVRAGHRVVFVSLTNGDIGHHEMAGGALAQRRAAECLAAARIGGYESIVLDHHDGELQPTLELRREIVRIIRRHEADIVMGHRPNDYHPDHRYGAMAVQDAAYMVCVPNFCPDTPALRKNPVFLHLMDHFQRPCPFRPDVAVPVDAVMSQKWALLEAMPSQMYEWLPWIEGRLDERPADPAQWRAWMESYWAPMFERPAQAWRDALSAWCGAERATAVRFAEFFEVSEYGHQPTPEDLRAMFAFI